MLLHLFHHTPSEDSLPKKFNCPFAYTPHPLCREAMEEVSQYLLSQKNWQEELQEGKMFGVLVVRTDEGQVGFLAAYSGILMGRNDHEYFVPPVYDMLSPNGFFKRGEAEISDLNHQIEKLEQEEEYVKLQSERERVAKLRDTTICRMREEMRTAKNRRNALRQATTLPPSEEERLRKESQFQKAELKRTEQRFTEEIARLEEVIAQHNEVITMLKQERKTRSAALQQRIFEQFHIHNAKGECRDILSIFEETVHKIPPAGTGECCAPKLLECAYRMGWRPLQMAEFWWGNSPNSEIRHHGHYYPSCKSKCEPLLNFMLRGLSVMPNPLKMEAKKKLKILYEDQDIVVVHKPEGMLTVRGKEDLVSVQSILEERYPEAERPMMVHRLDMATSGILVATKTKEAHHNLQVQFQSRNVKKRYVALLEHEEKVREGEISLPLCLDVNDRPRQMVNWELGKEALTHFEVVGATHHHARIHLYPITGRTHQLRLHMAHPKGLNNPIWGDNLYGTPADRLYLHAEYLKFRHPKTKEEITFTDPAEF